MNSIESSKLASFIVYFTKQNNKKKSIINLDLIHNKLRTCLF